MPKYEYKYRRPQRRRIKIHVILIVLAVLMVAAYPFFEARMLTIQEHTLYVSNLPSNLKSIRIAYASDIHQTWWNGEKRIAKVYQTLNNLSADIIILGGDYAVDQTTAIIFFENAPRLHARLGVFGVLGNHEYMDTEGGMQPLLDVMKDAGVNPLVNAVARVKVGQSYIYIAGADEFSGARADVNGLARQVHTEDFVIFAGHDPSLLLEAQKATDANGNSHWFDLAVFGHTHGGQINLFGYTPFKNTSKDLSLRYLTGWLEENRAGILISNGVGTSNLPIRLFAQPQVHLITLKAR
ncbi:MAG: metallophosphoesterase [Clostridia bacterium]|nr:metallophosphoesterase [Clostridia bacterium]